MQPRNAGCRARTANGKTITSDRNLARHENTPPSHDKFAGRTSTSYIDWATLTKHGMGIDVLSCPRCTSRLKPIGLITEPDVTERILVHVPLPLRPEQLHDAMTIVYDVTGGPVFVEVWTQSLRVRVHARKAWGGSWRWCLQG